MKRIRWIPAVISLTLLAGCIPSLSKDTKVNTETEKSEEAATIIPSMQISEQYYRTLLPYQESVSRGLVVSNIYSKYDVKEVESGLLRLSQRTFSPDDYFFQEGQMLDAEVLSSWLARSSQTKDGLNPSRPKEGNMTAELAKKAPVYLAHIVEQNYLVKSGENEVKLGGVSIGLAMNSTYYYQKEDFGATYEEPIPKQSLLSKGKRWPMKSLNACVQWKALRKFPLRLACSDKKAAIP